MCACVTVSSWHVCLSSCMRSCISCVNTTLLILRARLSCCSRLHVEVVAVVVVEYSGETGPWPCL